ncbi:hypothetical protein ABPG77_010046 [Micractinium sp. CCAP 211/92]
MPSWTEAVLKTSGGSECRDVIERMRAEAFWPEDQRREASQACEDLRLAVQEERAGPSYMQGFVNGWNQRAVRAAQALPPELKGPVKSCWKLMSLMDARAAQENVRYKATLSDGSTRIVNGNQLRGLLSVAEGKAFGGDIKAAAAAGGRKSAGRNLDRPARPEKKAAYAELTGVAQEENLTGRQLGQMKSNPETASKRQLPADLVAQLEAREPYKPANGQGKQLLINEQKLYLDELVRRCAVEEQGETNVYEIFAAMHERFGSALRP